MPLPAMQPGQTDERVIVHAGPAVGYAFGPVDEFAPDLGIRTPDGGQPMALRVTSMTMNGPRHYVILLVPEVLEQLKTALNKGIVIPSNGHVG
jgi:hypothetical protein